MLDRSIACNLDTAKACRICLTKQEIYHYPRENTPIVLKN